MNLNFCIVQKFGLLMAIVFFGYTNQSNAQSTKEFKTSNDTLIVYSDIPGLNETVPKIDSKDPQDIRVISNKYTIRVRSAASNNVWVDVFTHYTYSRALEIPKLPMIETGQPHSTNTQHYPDFTAGWSHTYGNIEMSKNQSVEVEIAAKPGFKIKNLDFFKATVHPAQKASLATVVNGKVYFTINNPAQVVIDINGQMDDHNALINPIGHPIHTISLFANPVLKKPGLNGSRTFYVENGLMPTVSSSTYDTLYFKPGAHLIGQNNKLYPGKVYYVPGDAIVFGTLNNLGVPQGSFQSIGDRIKFTGYGTISGVRSRHPYYVSTTEDHNLYKPIMIENAKNYEIYGITVVDPANHSVFIPSGENGYVLWAKVIAWRANGDGFGGNLHVNDCFMRTSDDASYARGNRKRCTFWKDHISGFFYMSQIPNTPFLIEDCDILYARSRDSDGLNGGVFNVRGDGTPTGQQNKVNLTFRNIRIHDQRSNMAIFNMVSYVGSANSPTSVGCSYDGVLFQNISIASSLVKQRLFGCATAPWYGGLIFDSVTFAGTKLTEANFKNYFNTNEFVKDLWFRIPGNFTITKNTNAAEGSITLSPVTATYIENSKVIATAVPKAGFEFVSWGGDASGTTNPLEITMTANKTITASFVSVGAKTLTATASANGTVVVNPPGTSQTTNSVVTLTAKPAVGYKFSGWSGDLTNNNIVSTLKIDGDKSVTANFVKANSFAINCGGDQHISADGTVYAQTPNGSYSTTATISATNDQFIYQSEKSGKTFSYDLPVDNGQYTVTLKFAEIFWQLAGKRIFDCSIEGNAVLASFDIFAEAGGRYKALDKTFNTTVADGILNISFTTTLDNAKISAIKVVNDQETSVSETSFKNSISVYPNPATDKLFFNSAEKQIDKIQLVDLTGKTVYSAIVQQHIGTIDLSGISSGLYIVKFYTSNTIFTSKVRVK